MRHKQGYIEKCRMMGRESQKVKRNERLVHLTGARPSSSILIFEIGTHNPKSGTYHHMEIRHEMVNGNNRYSVYLDGVRWHKQWSKMGFCRWLFGKIDCVRNECV